MRLEIMPVSQMMHLGPREDNPPRLTQPHAQTQGWICVRGMPSLSHTVLHACVPHLPGEETLCLLLSCVSLQPAHFLSSSLIKSLLLR